MPIKHEFVFKTIANCSDNIEPTELVLQKFLELRKDATTLVGKRDVRFEILVKMVRNEIIIDQLDTDGELTDFQLKTAKILHEEATSIIRKSAGPGGKIKLKFVLRM